VRRSSRLLAVGSSVVLCLVLAACVLPASAQLCVGSIAGIITDSSGAVVAVAHVTATDADKDFTFARYHRQRRPLPAPQHSSRPLQRLRGSSCLVNLQRVPAPPRGYAL
jgi:hypothetical protein